MAVISITATELGERLVSGIPFQLALSSNVPSTMFYTLDGTVPSLTSLVYLSPIIMPTKSSVRLRVLAISGSDSGSLDLTFSTDTTDLVIARRIDSYGAGIVVDAYGIIPVLLDGYKPDDNLVVDVPARYSDYELDDLDILYSRTGPNGEGEGTITENGPVIPIPDAIDFEASSPNNQNVYFNPRSMYIVIDGRIDGYEDQSVYLINRTYGDTMDLTKYQGGATMLEPNPYISGGYVRTFYAIKDGEGVSCSYYFNHNETKWVKNIQSFDPDDIPRVGDRQQFGPPLVFKWIYNRRSIII